MSSTYRRVTVPVQDGRMSASSAPSRPALTRPDGTPVRVLVVDDEPSLAELRSLAGR